MKLDQLRNRRLVCDTTSLLYLGRIGQLDLLPALFEKVVVPSQVALELDMGRFLRADTCDCRRLAWVNLVDVSPSDIESLPANRLGDGERAVIADGGWKTCGVSAEISALVAEKGFEFLKAPIKRVTLPDCPAPASRTLEKAYYPSSETICSVFRELLPKN